MIDKIFPCMGASNHSKHIRPKNDFYATDPHTVQIFLEKLKLENIILPKDILEPCCGQGHISEVLKSYGYNVTSYDLYEHGYGIPGIDFLKSDIKADCFFTNPPYKLALQFISKALQNVNPNGFVIMLLKLTFLEGKSRNKFFKEFPPKFVFVNSSRQICARNGDFKSLVDSSAVCYAWFMWEKGFKGDTIVKWID